jgi:hypothetical protein
MSPPKQSLSQLFNSFGPGAMMDLPTRSVVIAGLDHWDGNRAAFKSISSFTNGKVGARKTRAIAHTADRS